MKAYLTPDEVAETLRVKRKTVYEWIRNGRLAGAKLGRIWRIQRHDVEILAKTGFGAITPHGATALQPDAKAQARKKFLQEANAAFAELRNDPKAWQTEQEDRALWDRASGDGIGSSHVAEGQA